MIAPEGLIPKRSTELSAGYDFFAPEDIDLGNEWTVVNTRVRLTDEDVVRLYENIPEDIREDLCYLPMNWALFIYPKSGLSMLANQFCFSNGTPIVDMDYRGEIILKIKTELPLHIEKGQKFVQGIFQPVGILANEIPPTKKRNGGMGSTGRF